MGDSASLGCFEDSYQLLRKLGSGGEASVYLVRHIATEQLRAAKRISEKGNQNQLHELDMLKKLHHPGLPEVLDVQKGEDCVWLILSYICGMDVQLLCKGGMKRDLFFSIAEQLSEILCYLHTRKEPILHLDIKPTNLLLKKDGRLVLIDFGAAVRGNPGARPERCCGTPGFAAPEQYEKGELLDARTDLYGFGATMYCLLYGNAPAVRGTSGRRSGKGRAGRGRKSRQSRKHGNYCFLNWKIKWSPGSLREGDLWWKHSADSILQKCLAENPENRFSDSKALVLELRRTKKKLQRRQKRIREYVALLLFLMTVGFSFSALYTERDRQREDANERCVRLLAKAEKLGFGQALQCYKDASALCPEEGQIYVQLLERCMGDYVFTKEEESAVQALLFAVPSGRKETAAELLALSPEIYGRLSYELGLAYWYFYTESGGKAAAAQWFQEAVGTLDQNQMMETAGAVENGQIGKIREGVENGQIDKAEELSDQKFVEEEASGSRIEASHIVWAKSARIYARIAGYYEKVGKTDASGLEGPGYLELWKDLRELWNTESFQREHVCIRLSAAKELLSCIIMGASELKQGGVPFAELEEILQTMQQLRAECGTEEQKDWEECCEAAEAAVGRAYGKGGALQIDLQ